MQAAVAATTLNFGTVLSLTRPTRGAILSRSTRASTGICIVSTHPARSAAAAPAPLAAAAVFLHVTAYCNAESRQGEHHERFWPEADRHFDRSQAACLRSGRQPGTVRRCDAASCRRLRHRPHPDRDPRHCRRDVHPGLWHRYVGLGWALFLLLWPATVVWALVYYGLGFGNPASATIGMRVMDLEMRTWYGAPAYFLLGAVHGLVYWITVSMLTPFILAGRLLQCAWPAFARHPARDRRHQ